MDATPDPTDDLPHLIRDLRAAADEQRRLIAQLRDDLSTARAEADALHDTMPVPMPQGLSTRRSSLPPPQPLRRPLNPPDAPPPTTGLPPL